MPVASRLDSFPSKHQANETLHPVPAREGRPARKGFEYACGGVTNRHLAFAPLLGLRLVQATDCHTPILLTLRTRKLLGRVFSGGTSVPRRCVTWLARFLSRVVINRTASSATLPTVC